jgi:hypothetical protein
MDMARTVPVTTRGRVHEHEHVAKLDAGFTVNRERAAGPARVIFNLQDLAFWRETDRNNVFLQSKAEGNVNPVSEFVAKAAVKSPSAASRKAAWLETADLPCRARGRPAPLCMRSGWASSR